MDLVHPGRGGRAARRWWSGPTWSSSRRDRGPRAARDRRRRRGRIRADGVGVDHRPRTNGCRSQPRRLRRRRRSGRGPRLVDVGCGRRRGRPLLLRGRGGRPLLGSRGRRRRRRGAGRGGRWLVDVALSGVAARLAGPTLEVGDLDADRASTTTVRGRAPALGRGHGSSARRPRGGRAVNELVLHDVEVAEQRVDVVVREGTVAEIRVSRSSTRRRGGGRRARRRAHPRPARPPPPPGRHRRGPGIGALGPTT